MDFLYDDNDTSLSYDDDDAVNPEVVRRLTVKRKSATRLGSDCLSSGSTSSMPINDHEHHPQTPRSHQKPRRSLREQFVRAMSSPSRIMTSSPGRHESSGQKKSLRRKIRTPKSHKESQCRWEDLDLPRGITQEEALAILLSRELKMIDL